MTIRRLLPLMVALLGLALLLSSASSRAAGDNRVALVVSLGDGETATRCVSFPEESITGYEALQRSGLAFETEVQAGGAAVCSIEGRGCPADNCFCSCPGGTDCLYWSYWHQIDGEWVYSVAGAGLYRVSDGAVEGWVWGPGSVSQAPPPPDVSFADVCDDGIGSDAVAASSTTAEAAPRIIITDESGMVASYAATATAAAQQSEQGAGGGGSLVGFVGLLALLGVLGWAVSRRRNSHSESGDEPHSKP